MKNLVDRWNEFCNLLNWSVEDKVMEKICDLLRLEEGLKIINYPILIHQTC